MASSRILLLMDNRGDTNWGSQATTNSLVALLKWRFPEAEVRGLSRTANRPSGSLKRSLATALAQRGSRWAIDVLTSRWRSDFEWADLVVVNGEGTLHPQPQAIRWVCSVSALAKETNNPYWVINCSLRCKGDKTEPLFATFFQGAEHVAAREPVSFREMVSIGASAVQAADCAWLTEPAPVEEARAILKRVGIEGRFAVMTGSASVHKWPIEHQRSVVDTLLKRGMGVVYTYSDKKDASVASALALPTVTHKEADYRQLTAMQSMAEIVVGGRFHPTILSALVGTPFVALPSNTHKMSGLMEQIGAPELLCDFASVESVVQTIESVLDERAMWSDRLRARSREIAPLAYLNVKP